MGVVVIASNNYTVYGDLPSAKLYIAALVGPAADAWNALATDDLKSKTLVTAKNLIDRKPWKGKAVSPLPALQWPRTGVTLSDGTVVDPATVPVAIVNAEYEMAVIITGDPSTYGAADSGTNVKSAKIATLQVENFRPLVGSILPAILMDMVGMYLGDTSGAGAGIVSGSTDACGNNTATQFDDDSTYSRTRDW